MHGLTNLKMYEIESIFLNHAVCLFFFLNDLKIAEDWSKDVPLWSEDLKATSQSITGCADSN